MFPTPFQDLFIVAGISPTQILVSLWLFILQAQGMGTLHTDILCAQFG